MPKVSLEASTTPYVGIVTHGAQVNPSYLVDEKERKLSNGIRHVQDPVELKIKSGLVCFLIKPFAIEFFYEENYPKTT
jgi:hypothetical protein